MAILEVVKKVGAKNEKGEYIIPLEYDEIKRLKTGVYIATRCISDDFLSGYSYHLYTEEGRLDYHWEGCITEVLYDENEEIFALKVKNLSTSEWHLVEIDYEKNLINKPYKNSIDSVELLSNNCIKLSNSQGETKIFSRKLKQVIYDLGKSAKIYHVGKQGFIIKRDGFKGFVNLEGKQVLDYRWDHIVLQDEFITVAKKIKNGEYNFGLYTYEGKEVLPCGYWGMEYLPGITPELCCIDGKKVWLFNTHKKMGKFYYDELIKADGEPILSISGNDIFMSGVSIWVYEGTNVIVKQKNKATLYRLEMNAQREIKAVVVCEAGKIEKLGNYGLYEIYKGRKKGICNKDGTMIEPLRFIVRKE